MTSTCPSPNKQRAPLTGIGARMPIAYQPRRTPAHAHALLNLRPMRNEHVAR
jgi:hypothetical protein